MEESKIYCSPTGGVLGKDAPKFLGQLITPMARVLGEDAPEFSGTAFTSVALAMLMVGRKKSLYSYGQGAWRRC